MDKTQWMLGHQAGVDYNRHAHHFLGGVDPDMCARSKASLRTHLNASNRDSYMCGYLYARAHGGFLDASVVFTQQPEEEA